MSLHADLPHFQSFIMAGFESTFALAAGQRRLDLLAATRHDELVHQDYTLMIGQGIQTVRESLAWHQIDKGNGQYDFSRHEPLLQAGAELGIQQLWDLNHFDYPEDLNPFDDVFIDRFAHYAGAAVRKLREYSKHVLYIVPINEISFLSWIGADRGWWAPYTVGRDNGFRLKKQLVKASIAAMDAMREADDGVRFILVDPFMRRLAKAPASRAALRHVRDFNTVVRFEAWDMLAGLKYPELGGNPRYLDIIGVNYYIHNQEWVISQKGRGRRFRHQLMDWTSDDRVSFATMLQEVYERYQRPLVVSETGSFGDLREQWLERTLNEIDEAVTTMGLPVAGVCIYPILDRPESAGFLLPNSGVWDFAPDDSTCRRIPHQPSLSVLSRFRRRWKRPLTPSKSGTTPVRVAQVEPTRRQTRSASPAVRA